ncbi:hypothetical protein [Enterovibrio nigricans]|uniref:Uncharacterized protein n=1 Tax=Enterovibrio nigricans DSM 22720 TaxID=1121868 RepID=A0A1T4VW18_9GAMM|nr:hypothetical protein [Enterovibrio nigricans]SKA69156.1 hypothetical protein SAMN02745132_04410 [Enterovibrio nigricans DSM 22720]
MNITRNGLADLLLIIANFFGGVMSVVFFPMEWPFALLASLVAVHVLLRFFAG